MIIPEYWAEARARHRDPNRQITMRRLGWSDDSPEAAQAHAQQRADDALARALVGERVERSEPRVPYNGAVGTPIREEILARFDDVVITRNAYGAHCLNVPNVLIADIDLEERTEVPYNALVSLAAFVASAIAGVWTRSFLVFIGVQIACTSIRYAFTWLLRKLFPPSIAKDRLEAQRQVASFIQQHTDWSVRVYETPNGLRVIATHRLFEANDPEVAKFFDACDTDPYYRLMCRNQQCFRARLTAKPWRIGVDKPMRPRPGVWPVEGNKLDMRMAWVDHYEPIAQNFAACRFLESLGRGSMHPVAQRVADLHDRLSRANTSLPLA